MSNPKKIGGGSDPFASMKVTLSAGGPGSTGKVDGAAEIPVIDDMAGGIADGMAKALGALLGGEPASSSLASQRVSDPRLQAVSPMASEIPGSYRVSAEVFNKPVKALLTIKPGGELEAEGIGERATDRLVQGQWSYEDGVLRGQVDANGQKTEFEVDFRGQKMSDLEGNAKAPGQIKAMGMAFPFQLARSTAS